MTLPLAGQDKRMPGSATTSDFAGSGEAAGESDLSAAGFLSATRADLDPAGALIKIKSPTSITFGLKLGLAALFHCTTSRGA